MLGNTFLLFYLAFLGVQADVPHGPAPEGCSKHEIIVGKYSYLSRFFSLTLMPPVARGTSEPGPFGSIVGDPLVKAVVAAVPGSRGYACQVRVTISG
jgi:hypothetical protein